VLDGGEGVAETGEGTADAMERDLKRSGCRHGFASHLGKRRHSRKLWLEEVEGGMVSGYRVLDQPGQDAPYLPQA
jgi:hypothetical protein